MKYAIPIIILGYLFNDVHGQTSSKNESLILNVKYANCNDKFLYIIFREKGTYLFDTLWPNKNGVYHLVTNKLKSPQEILITSDNKTQINSVIVAPGYNLTISGDASDFWTLYKTKRITGIGSQSNRFNIILDSIGFSKKNTTNINSLKEAIAVMSQHMILRDSIANIVFNKPGYTEPYLAYFREKIKYDNLFLKLNMLFPLQRSYGLSFEKLRDVIQNNYDSSILKNLSDEKYLISTEFQKLLVGEYFEFLLHSDYLKDSSLRNSKIYPLQKIVNIYHGKVQQYAIAKYINQSFSNSKSSEELIKEFDLFRPFTTGITNTEYIQSIETNYKERLADFSRTEIGKPAPNFRCKDPDGKINRLSDFVGKVIYIDFWASWCLPCREETPYLKNLQMQYSKNPSVIFISIAVSDTKKDWIRAIKQDKPIWLQLFDENKKAQTDYATFEIPRFVIIDKKGNIVSYDAPPPSKGSELVKILDQEIRK